MDKHFGSILRTRPGQRHNTVITTRSATCTIHPRSASSKKANGISTLKRLWKHAFYIADNIIWENRQNNLADVNLSTRNINSSNHR